MLKDALIAQKSLIMRDANSDYSRCLRRSKLVATEALVKYSGIAATEYNATMYRLVWSVWIKAVVLSQTRVSFAAPDRKQNVPSWDV